MNFMIFPPIYMYILRKKIKGFEIAMNNFFQKSPYLELASTKNMAPPMGTKLIYETRIPSIKKYDPIMGIIVTLV